jgi:hypothetical protein
MLTAQTTTTTTTSDASDYDRGHFSGTRGGVPALVHQTWQSHDVGGEADFKSQMDRWRGNVAKGGDREQESGSGGSGGSGGFGGSGSEGGSGDGSDGGKSGGGGGEIGGDVGPSSSAWTHVVWSDSQLNRLLGLVAPWLRPTLRRMRRSKPVDKIDTMRFAIRAARDVSMRNVSIVTGDAVALVLCL